MMEAILSSKKSVLTGAKLRNVLEDGILQGYRSFQVLYVVENLTDSTSLRVEV
jgi:hypothetical protein